MATILKLDPVDPDSREIAGLRARLDRDEVLVIPTDTVYGLAANPFSLVALDRVYAIKGRSRHKPLPLLVGSIAMAEEVAREIPEIFYMLVEQFWPGPLTLILRAGAKLPRRVTADTGHVAMRLPRAPIAVAISNEAGYPLVGTSANLSGMPECGTAIEADLQLGDRVGLIVDGGAANSRTPSTILDLTCVPPRVIRDGVIAPDRLAPFLE
jgi:L-threonylcarbamoyladenylate synthase